MMPADNTAGFGNDNLTLPRIERGTDGPEEDIIID